MKALYLKFASEAEARSTLYSNDEPLFRNVDTIGTIYEPQTDEDTPPVALDGWHVNVLLMDDEDETPLMPFETAPTTPRRTWASLPPAPPVVPESITRAQARAVLILQGLIDAVQPAIDSIDDPTQRALVQNDWDHRLTFERGNPTLLALAGALGLDDEGLDALFVKAAKL